MKKPHTRWLQVMGNVLLLALVTVRLPAEEAADLEDQLWETSTQAWTQLHVSWIPYLEKHAEESLLPQDLQKEFRAGIRTHGIPQAEAGRAFMQAREALENVGTSGPESGNADAPLPDFSAEIQKCREAEVALVEEIKGMRAWWSEFAEKTRPVLLEAADSKKTLTFKGYRLGMSRLDFALLHMVHFDEALFPDKEGRLFKIEFVPDVTREFENKGRNTGIMEKVATELLSMKEPLQPQKVGRFTREGLDRLILTGEQTRRLWKVEDAGKDTFIRLFLENYLSVSIPLNDDKPWSGNILQQRIRPAPEKNTFVTKDPLRLQVENLDEGYVLTLDRIRLAIELRVIQKADEIIFD